MAHLNARRVAVEQQPANLRLQHADKFSSLAQIIFGPMNCCCQVSMQTLCNCDEFAWFSVMNQQRRRSEDLLLELVIRCEVRQWNAEDRSATGCAIPGCRAFKTGDPLRLPVPMSLRNSSVVPLCD